jgi:hypothetical protein
MENLIIWNDVTEVLPKEGQKILFSYSLKHDDRWIHGVEIGTYHWDKLPTSIMKFMTHWTEAPEPVISEEE